MSRKRPAMPGGPSASGVVHKSADRLGSGRHLATAEDRPPSPSATVHRWRVSVGLPVYNGEQYLEEALRSLVDQSFTSFEVIVMDNASTDHTPSICRAFAARDERVRYVRSDVNRGAARNFNTSFELASGEYFKWAAHDDLCAPDFLLRCVEALDRDPSVVLAYPTPVRIDDLGRRKKAMSHRLDVSSPTPSTRFGQVMKKPNWCLPIFGVIRRSTLAATPLMEGVGSDHALLAELSLHGRFHEVAEPLFLHREHAGRFVRSHKRTSEKEAWWDPAWAATRPLPKWHQLARYVGAVRRAPLDGPERLRCYAHVARWAGRSAGQLVGDLSEWRVRAVARKRGLANESPYDAQEAQSEDFIEKP